VIEGFFTNETVSDGLSFGNEWRQKVLEKLKYLSGKTAVK
jgi:hypothetical protein